MMQTNIALIGLLFLNIITISHGSPCNFTDSISINNGVQQANKSIVFNGIEYPPNQYFSHTANQTDGSERVVVRGCICNIRKCIRLCCPHESFVTKTTEEGMECGQDQNARNFKAEVRDENGKTNIQNLDDHFGYVDRICKVYYIPEPEDFVITYAGDVIAQNRTLNHREYCIKASFHETKGVNLEARICIPDDEIYDPPPPPASFSYLPYVIFASIPFLITTFLVYICLPELRNLHGKCFLCYLVCLMMMYILLALEQLNGTDYVDPRSRKVQATLSYFATFSAFLWLNVISFDLWSSFRFTVRVRPLSETKQMILYGLYAFGGSLVLNIVAHVMDSIDGLPDCLQPGLGVDSLFLKVDFTSRMIFYYGPLCIIVTVNLLFTTLTAMKIFRIQLDVKKLTLQVKRNELRSGLSIQKDSYLMYVRLFIVTGGTWIAQAIWFLANDNTIFSLMDILNCAQGILIFVLFVLKRRVLRLIKKSWQINSDRYSSDQNAKTNIAPSSETKL